MRWHDDRLSATHDAVERTGRDTCDALIDKAQNEVPRASVSVFLAHAHAHALPLSWHRCPRQWPSERVLIRYPGFSLPQRRIGLDVPHTDKTRNVECAMRVWRETRNLRRESLKVPRRGCWPCARQIEAGGTLEKCMRLIWGRSMNGGNSLTGCRLPRTHRTRIIAGAARNT
jgi:hypothetical protein